MLLDEAAQVMPVMRRKIANDNAQTRRQMNEQRPEPPTGPRHHRRCLPRCAGHRLAAKTADASFGICVLVRWSHLAEQPQVLRQELQQGAHLVEHDKRKPDSTGCRKDAKLEWQSEHENNDTQRRYRDPLRISRDQIRSDAGRTKNRESNTLVIRDFF